MSKPFCGCCECRGVMCFFQHLGHSHACDDRTTLLDLLQTEGVYPVVVRELPKRVVDGRHLLTN